MAIPHPCDVEQWEGDCLQKEILYPFFSLWLFSQIVCTLPLSLSLPKFLSEFKYVPVVSFTHVLADAQFPIQGCLYNSVC